MYHVAMTQWIVGDEKLEDSCKRLNRFGYDGIEFAADPAALDASECKRLMKKYQLDCRSLCGIFGETRDLTSDSWAGENAVQYIKDSVDFANAVGAKVIIVVPSPVGRITPPDGMSRDDLWKNAVKNLREAGIYAGEHGVNMAIEAINRYETFFVNKMEEAYALAEDVGLPSVGIMADLFHMSIEEASLSESVTAYADRLLHVHVADSNRGPAGYGHTDFAAILRTLGRIGYQGSLTMEYMYRIADPYSVGEIHTKTALMDEYAEQAIRYIRTLDQSTKQERV